LLTNDRRVASPKPEAPPVITATLPLISILNLLCYFILVFKFGLILQSLYQLYLPELRLYPLPHPYLYFLLFTLKI
ncbi:MAG: hypothetical protein J7K84_01095, partial [Deltaproteobacteria bacterium]|nr:hypothetical protein [Deltaproteobacteria bacterium]